MTIEVETQVVTISAREYRSVERKSSLLFCAGLVLVVLSLGIGIFTDNAKSNLTTYVLLISSVCLGFLLLVGSTWYKNRTYRNIALKNGWDGKTTYDIETEDEQSFLHE